MRIEDLLIETNLEEGPFARQLNRTANNAVRAIPGVVGSAAKGIGAVAGGAAGAWDKAKQGFQAGRAAVNGTAGTQPGQPAQAVAPAQAEPQQIEPTMDPALDTPAAIRNAAAPTSNETNPRNNVTTTNAPAAGKRIGVPQGTQAVDNAMTTVNSVRADRRQKVIDYAQQALDQAEQELAAIRKNAGMAPAQPNLQVQQGGKAPVQAPQQAVA